jgi:crotonobetainyl-CoA:carnitine CoA-transferase CaiB-like acyl-CoA transferase
MLAHGRGSVFYDDHNRNKRAMTLDLNKDEGRRVAYDLLRNSDVFLSNFRPKVLARMGLDYPSLHSVNKRLVYATASGLGRKGPDADRASIAFVVDARSGMMMAGGEEGQDPSMVPVGVGDRITSIFLAYGIVSALLQREKTGEGQEIHASQLMSMMTLFGNTISSCLWLGKPFPRFDHSFARNPIYNYYKCKDGKWIALSNRQSDKYWSTFCQVTGLSDLEHDPRYEDAERRAENYLELLQIITDMFATKTSREWEGVLSRGDLLFSIIQDIPDVVNDPQVIANNYIVDWEHPVTGPTRMMAPPVEFSQNPCTIRRAPPAFGEHTEEVLQEFCGYDWDRISELKEKGAI